MPPIERKHGDCWRCCVRSGLGMTIPVRGEGPPVHLCDDCIGEVVAAGLKHALDLMMAELIPASDKH